MLCFATLRLIQAFVKRDLPLLLIILNFAWVGGYSLSLICYLQWDSRDTEIRQFGNWLLSYCNPDTVRRYERWGSLRQLTMTNGEVHEQRRTGLHLLFGLVLFLGNPGVHTTLVNETPCAPHFTSSLVFECEGYKGDAIPFLHKIPFIFIEYYMILAMFVSITYNWSAY